MKQLRACHKKVRFGSEKAAQYTIDKIKNKSKRSRIPTRAYKCNCGAWHLTSKPDNRKNLTNKS